MPHCFLAKGLIVLLNAGIAAWTESKAGDALEACFGFKTERRTRGSGSVHLLPFSNPQVAEASFQMFPEFKVHAVQLLRDGSILQVRNTAKSPWLAQVVQDDSSEHLCLAPRAVRCCGSTMFKASSAWESSNETRKETSLFFQQSY